MTCRQYTAKLLSASLQRYHFREAVIGVSQDAPCHWSALLYYSVYYFLSQMRIWSWFLCPKGKEGALLTQGSYDKNCRTGLQTEIPTQNAFLPDTSWKATTVIPRNIPHSQGGSLPWISAEELLQEFLQPNTVCWRTSLTALTLVPLSHISVSLHLVKSSLWGITLKSHKKQDVSNVNDQIKPALQRQHT